MFFAKATYAELRQGYTKRNGFILTRLSFMFCKAQAV